LFDKYLYLSGTTATLRNDFRNFAEELTERFGPKSVLDIACNDGSQLDQFKNLGWKTIGIDPARNILDLSIKNHIVICDYLRAEHANFIKADVAIAQNVLAHTNDPTELIDTALGIAEVFFAQTSQAMMVQNGEFDTIYHEHLSFFSEKSLATLAVRAKKVLRSVTLREIHGTSFLFEIGNSGSQVEFPTGPTLEDARQFGFKARKIVDQLSKVIHDERDSGSIIIGYGASAKGMTVINALDSEFDYFIDDSPLKQGRYTPGKNVPIKDSAFLSTLTGQVTFVMTAWNFEKEIKERISQHFKGEARFIRYFPEVVIS
jgi:SAM-dependent methyltransferase